MELIRPFERIGKGDAAIAGGKGASLGEMTQAGIPVPPGFVLLSNAFEQFLEETDLSVEIDSILHNVNKEEMHTVEHASEKIQQLILAAKMSDDIRSSILQNYKTLNAKFVAVRSSATAEDSASAAWAGQLDTFLNTTEDSLLENVQKCWASLFTPRAIFYRFEKDLHHTKISVAVVVQKMIQSEVSGIAFSVHPVTEDRNQMIIEAGFGLGEAIVSGQVTPDSYVIEKTPLRIIDKNITYQSRALWKGNPSAKDNPSGGSGHANEWHELSEAEGSKPALSDEQALELAEIILRIENHYGFPCDIEWAFEAGTFFITQSRPITTLSAEQAVPKIIFEKQYTRDFAAAMSQTWLYSLDRLSIESGWGNLPVQLYIMVMRDDLIEEWENAHGLQWFVDKMHDENKKGRVFFEKYSRVYNDSVDKLKKYLDQGAARSTEELGEMIELLSLACVGWDVMYYSAGNDRTPSDIRAEALKLRDQDTLGDSSNPYIEKSLRALYPQLGDLVVYILKTEIQSPPTMEELTRRQKSFVIPDYRGELITHTISFADFEREHPEFDFKTTTVVQTEENIIHGEIGYKGRVTGRVRVLKRKKQISELQEGEILVTSMTTPAFISAMRKAAAFITDEGGITSHAAIIARELKKPCVIGTKVATRLLKDGDMVEVDADNGIVRVIQPSLDSLVEKIKAENWSRDWAVEISLITVTMSIQFYGKMQEIFGVSEEKYLTFQKKDHGTGYLPIGPYERIGEILQKHARDETFVDKWCARFKELSDIVMDLIKLSPEQLMTRLSELYELNDEYCAWQAATKNVVNFLAPDMPESTFEKFKEARLYSETYYEQLDAAMHGIADYILRSHPEYSRDQLTSMTFAELLNYVKTESLPEASELQKRYEYSGLYFVNSAMHLLSEDEVRSIEAHWAAQMDVNNIRGTTAYPGIVRGVARIRMKSSSGDIREGEILVTGMTHPDFLPLMKKAGAIVTDVGGALCHAAIVSREMKKPCIIGTKYATQVIKDGDLLEVDANEGVVRILK